MLAGALACSSRPREDERLLGEYLAGMSRNAAQLLHSGRSPNASLSRPDDDWWLVVGDDWGIARRAIAFERRHFGRVHTCDAYLVFRSSSNPVPNPTPGLWCDYLYFDVDGRLLGFDREFLD